MDSKGVSVLKFVGTVSLGIVTGVSYTLTTLTVPTLLALPTASSASRSLETLAASARSQLRLFSGLSSTAFVGSYFLSPREHRHPYLIYTTFCIVAARLVTSERVAPLLSKAFAASSSASSLVRANRHAAGSSWCTGGASRTKSKEDGRKAWREPRRMDASFELLSEGLDEHSSESPSAEEAEDAAVGSGSGEVGGVNGESTRHQVETFLERSLVQTFVSGLGFAMAVVGIWGEGAIDDVIYLVGA